MRLLQREPRSKVFGVGLSKTATTSLFAALDILGYRSATFRHMRDRGLNQWFEGNFRPDYFRGWDAITDLPIATFFKDLDARYPQSKFILTLRPKDSWMRSCRQYFGEPRIGSFYERTMMRTYGAITFNEDLFSQAYDSHLANVRAYFEQTEPERLLEFDVFSGDGWPKLCHFLEHPVPDESFPNVKPGYITPQEIIRNRHPRFIAENLTKRAIRKTVSLFGKRITRL